MQVVISRPYTVAFLMLSCFWASGCPRPTAECRAFYDLSPDERVAAIRSAPIEKQLDYYKCGVYQEPPTNYADVVAEGGERMIPAVLERIKSLDKAEACFRAQLLIIFEKMAQKGDLRKRPDVLEQVRAVPDGIPFDDCREEAWEHVKRIERSYGQYQ